MDPHTTAEILTDIQRILKIDLTKTVAQNGKTYSENSITIQIDEEQFKPRLQKCQKKYPQIAFFPNYASRRQQFKPLIGPVIGGLIVFVIKIAVDWLLLS